MSDDTLTPQGRFINEVSRTDDRRPCYYINTRLTLFHFHSHLSFQYNQNLPTSLKINTQIVTATMCGGAIIADLIPRPRRLNPTNVWPNSTVYPKLNPFQSEFNHFVEETSPVHKRAPLSSGNLFHSFFFSFLCFLYVQLHFFS